MPSRETNNRATWGSHVPVNNAILETTTITGVLELGIGYNSTPALFESSPYVLGVENDLAWIEEMRNSGMIKEDENHKLIHHDLPGVTRSTRRDTLEEQHFANLESYYNNIYNSKIGMVFVDCYSSSRYTALRFFAKKNVDVITFHDYQLPTGLRNHYNGGVEDVVPDNYSFYIDKTYVQHTGIWIRKDFEHDIEAIIEATKHHASKWIPGSEQNVNIVTVN